MHSNVVIAARANFLKYWRYTILLSKKERGNETYVWKIFGYSDLHRLIRRYCFSCGNSSAKQLCNVRRSKLWRDGC